MIEQAFKHPLTDIGLAKFLADWEKAQATRVVTAAPERDLKPETETWSPTPEPEMDFIRRFADSTPRRARRR